MCHCITQITASRVTASHGHYTSMTSSACVIPYIRRIISSMSSSMIAEGAEMYLHHKLISYPFALASLREKGAESYYKKSSPNC